MIVEMVLIFYCADAEILPAIAPDKRDIHMDMFLFLP